MGAYMRSGDRRGFTLLELMIVVTIIGILTTIAVPSFQWAGRRAREAVLKENLFSLRDTIDQHFADKGSYPSTLNDLVSAGYLRRVPDDPITKSSSTWTTVPPPDGESSGIFDVHSGAPGTGSDGTAYADW